MYAIHPRQGMNLGSYHSPYPDNWINLETHSFPNGMNTIDVYFTNELDDDYLSVLDLKPYSIAWMRARYPS